tara:strand:- start:296 stop:502 length:207 start_codon:yes stop_codon:yes gene_type:complete
MIKNKYSSNKIYLEKIGQKFFFGRDNLPFKTVNMAYKQKYINICKDFKIKKINKKNILFLHLVIINII